MELMKDWVRSLFLILLAMGSGIVKEKDPFSLVIMATILYPVIRLTGGV